MVKQAPTQGTRLPACSPSGKRQKNTRGPFHPAATSITGDRRQRAKLLCIDQYITRSKMSLATKVFPYL